MHILLQVVPVLKKYLSYSAVMISITVNNSNNNNIYYISNDVINTVYFQINDVRYLVCPAAFSVGNLKKFIRMKFDLKPKYEVCKYFRYLLICVRIFI